MLLLVFFNKCKLEFNELKGETCCWGYDVKFGWKIESLQNENENLSVQHCKSNVVFFFTKKFLEIS